MAEFKEYYENKGAWFYAQLLIAEAICIDPKNSVKYSSYHPALVKRTLERREITINGTNGAK